MSKTTRWATAGILAVAAATAMAGDNPKAAVAALERRVEQLERSIERLERTVARLEANRSERQGMMGGMMGEGGMMGGGGMMDRSRPNEQWRAPEKNR